VSKFMTELSHWQSIVVTQQDQQFGCIPCSFEWMIRYKGIEGLKNTFQKDVSLEHNNSFESVTIEAGKQYPEVNIKHKDFHDGKRTVDFIKNHIEKDLPCLIVYPKINASGKLEGHAAPVVFVDDKTIKVISSADENGNQTREFPIACYLYWYTNCGCSDVAWLDDHQTCQPKSNNSSEQADQPKR